MKEFETVCLFLKSGMTWCGPGKRRLPLPETGREYRWKNFRKNFQKIHFWQWFLPETVLDYPI